MTEATLATVLLVGDIVLDQPDPSRYFRPTRDFLLQGDLVVGHVEVPHTARGQQAAVDVPAHGSDPAHLLALAESGFGVATLAGNHVYDAGDVGVADTVLALRNLGISTSGAGGNLSEARAPAIVTKAGMTIGVLSYNTIGPRASWATTAKAGCAYVEIITHYELDYPGPGGPPGRTYSFAEPMSLRQMKRDIERLKRDVDIVVVGLHKGIVHTPVALAMYERPLAEAAIDAGADIVVGHHAHILKGVEIYRGKPIFHGLGNFVTVTNQLSVDPTANPSPERLAWAKRRKALFGFEPDPSYPTYPFHPEAKNTMIAACEVSPSGNVSAGFRPCRVRPDGAPELLGNDAAGNQVLDYVKRITREAELDTQFEWCGDRVVFTSGEND